MLLAIYAILVTVFSIGLLYPSARDFFQSFVLKLDAESNLLCSQAKHVDQTAEVERSTLEATIKAYEKQGANKLRTEIAGLKGDLPKIESLVGSKLNAVPVADYAAILDELKLLKAEIQQLREPSPAVDPRVTVRGAPFDETFAGQPSPGSGIPA